MHFVLNPWHLHAAQLSVDTRAYALPARPDCLATTLNTNSLHTIHPMVHRPVPRCTPRCQATAAPAATQPAAAPNLLPITRSVPDHLLANGTGMQLSFLGAPNSLPPGFRCVCVQRAAHKAGCMCMPMYRRKRQGRHAL